jgi:MFS family permease
VSVSGARPRADRSRDKGGVFRSLREPNYRRYFVGHAVSVTGTWMQRMGQDWLVLELTDSGTALGLIMFCQFAPVLFGGLWAGVVIDRTDLRRLIFVTQALQCVLATVLAALTLTDALSLWMVFVLATLLGVVSTFDTPARQAFVSELVRDEDAMNAQALNSVIHNTGRLVGPAVAGALIAVAGVGATFVVNAVSFAAVLLSLVFIERAALQPRERALKAPGQVREGLRYVWGEPALRWSIIAMGVVSVFAQQLRVVLPLLAVQTFDGGPQAYGWLTAMLGLGAILGALLTASRVNSTAVSLLRTCLMYGVSCLLVALAPVFAFALAGTVLVGLSNTSFNTHARALMLISAEPQMRGRAMAVHAVLFMGGAPVGAIPIGVVCDVAGARAGMLVAAVSSLLVAAVLLPRVRSLATSAPRLCARPKNLSD